MFGGRDADDSGPKVPLGDRLKNALLKPVDPNAVPKQAPDHPETVEELQAAVKYANDKERLIGLTAAPLAAILGLVIISADISNDPAALLKNGQVNKLHTNVSTLHELLAVLLVLSVVMLFMAMLRKRLYLGMVTALYGLSVFNLHWWGFGVPYVMIGAWLLIRAYRLQRSLKEATGGTGDRRGGSALPPGPSRRYTPPSSPKRSISPKSEDERRAG
jgi:hypothetical protein